MQQLHAPRGGCHALECCMKQPKGLGSTGCMKQSNAAATHKHPSSNTRTSCLPRLLPSYFCYSHFACLSVYPPAVRHAADPRGTHPGCNKPKPNPTTQTTTTTTTTTPAACSYFEEHVKQPVLPGQAVEISVQCDSDVFAWLFAWVQAKKGQAPRPQLGPATVLPVLISSSFLRVSVGGGVEVGRSCVLSDCSL